MEISERIRMVRRMLNLTQAQFGESLGVSRDVVANIESNRLKNPNQKEPLYHLICKQHSVSEKWLRTGEGEMFELDRDAEIADFIGTALSDETDSFKKRFASMLAQLDETEWQLLEKMARKLAEKKDQA